MVNIFIKAEGATGIWFEVVNDVGRCLLQSGRFKTICRVETALAALWDVAAEPDAALLGKSAGKVQLASARKLRRVPLHGEVTLADLHEALTDIPRAYVTDKCPKERRRTDLTGPMRLLAH